MILSRKGTQRSSTRRQASTASRSTPSSCSATCALVITKEQTGRSLRQVRAMNANSTALVTNTRSDLALQFSELQPTVTRAAFGPVIVIRPAQTGSRSTRARARARLRRRHRPGDLSDAARQLADRRQVAQPVVVPAELAVGEGREAGPAGAGKPARHALDGPLGDRRRHPRHAGRRLDRLLGLARLHPHAHPRGGVALQPRDRRHAGLHRLGVR